ncbi:MAG: malto-oligosyltrehalose synthase, partial [Propionicimonas sp.]
LKADKARLTATILRLRRRRPAGFVGEHASYLPLTSTTPLAWGFARGDDLDAVTIATRLHRRLDDAGGWQAPDSVHLPRGTWRNLLTGASLRGELRPLTDLGGWPCAVLERV